MKQAIAGYKHDVGDQEFVTFGDVSIVDPSAGGDGVADVGGAEIGDLAARVDPGLEPKIADQDFVRELKQAMGIECIERGDDGSERSAGDEVLARRNGAVGGKRLFG